MNKCDVIIPIFNAYEALDECVVSIIKNTDLKQNGLVFFEIGQGQYMDVTAIMEKKGFRLVGFYYDLGQIMRVLVFSR